MNLLIRTAKKNRMECETIHYNFKTKDNGVAGICPDCKGIVSFNSYHQRYQCTTKECCFEANLKKERVWDNSMRGKFLGKEKENELG